MGKGYFAGIDSGSTSTDVVILNKEHEIVTGIILAIGRIVGESAALLFTAGSGYLLPKGGMGILKKILESGGTLTIQLYLSMAKAEYSTAFGIAVILLLIVLFINWITKVLAKKLDVNNME